MSAEYSINHKIRDLRIGNRTPYPRYARTALRDKRYIYT